MRILTISDSPTLSSGMGNTIRRINKVFVEGGHAVKQIAWGYKGEKHDFPYTLYDTGSDYYGEGIFQQVLDEYQPDVIFTHGDVFAFSWMLKFPKTYKWIGYLPIDGGDLPSVWAPIVQAVDELILVSQFAADEVRKICPNKDIRIIPHGVDTTVFIPKDKEYLKHKYGLEDKFIVGFVGRNQPRKNIPALMQAFKAFAENKDDACLYLHTVPRDQGWDIYELVRRYGLKGKVYVTAQLSPVVGISEEHLVNIYNLFDVFILPSTGEGFGLPLLEAQACGVPTFATGYSACTELVPDRQLISVATTYVEAVTNLSHAHVDVQDIVNKLEEMYSNPEVRSEYGKEGREFALAYDWRAIEPMFNLILEGDEVNADSIQRGYTGFVRI